MRAARAWLLRLSALRTAAWVASKLFPRVLLPAATVRRRVGAPAPPCVFISNFELLPVCVCDQRFYIQSPFVYSLACSACELTILAARRVRARGTSNNKQQTTNNMSNNKNNKSSQEAYACGKGCVPCCACALSLCAADAPFPFPVARACVCMRVCFPIPFSPPTAAAAWAGLLDTLPLCPIPSARMCVRACVSFSLCLRVSSSTLPPLLLSPCSSPRLPPPLHRSRDSLFALS